jgi:hypothetical protein
VRVRPGDRADGQQQGDGGHRNNHLGNPARSAYDDDQQRDKSE